MERTGGESDVVRLDKKSGEFIFVDYPRENPMSRHGVCYYPE
jgi:hypothetical protein